MDYSLISLQLKLLFGLHVKRTVHRQDFGAKLSLTNNNGAHVVDILDCLFYTCKSTQLNMNGRMRKHKDVLNV